MVSLLRGLGTVTCSGLGVTMVVCVQCSGTSGMALLRRNSPAGMATGWSLALPLTYQVALPMSLVLSKPGCLLVGFLGSLGALCQPSPGCVREAPAFRCFNNRNH